MEDHALERVPEGERHSWLKISWNTVGLITTLVILFFGAVVCFVAGVKIALLAGVVLIVGLAAGSYPAFFLSSFTPQAAIKGRFAVRGKGHAVLRKGLVLVQFAVGFAVVFGTSVIVRQMDYFNNRALGFDRAHIIVIGRANALGASADAFENELLSRPDILQISRSEAMPGRHFDSTGHLLEGQPAAHRRRQQPVLRRRLAGLPQRL
mgnify:CR=1 FL=1